MSDSTRTIILAESHSFEFFSMPDKRLYISVLLGGWGWEQMCVPLNEVELSLYREFGDYHIEKLAAKIRLNPESYRSRAVKV
jgi:hypothetical protein